MKIKDFIQGLGEKARERKELMRQAEDNFRIHKTIEERQKSANERELEKFQNEDREENIKEALDVMRKKREEDIRFGHNPLDVKNITSHTEWEVLKEKNQFAQKGNMFVDQEASVLRNNPNLMKNNRSLCGI